MPHLTTMNRASPTRMRPCAQQMRGERAPIPFVAPTPRRGGEASAPRAIVREAKGARPLWRGRGRARALYESCLLTLGIVLAGPVAAYTTERPHRPVLSHRTIHHLAVVHHATFSAPAVGARAEVPDAAGPWPHPSNGHETDGLSRNPDDCARYGCVDNGGG